MTGNRRPSSRAAAGILLALSLLTLGMRLPAESAGAPFGAWIYLRGGQPLGEAERVVEVLAVGDVMPGRGLAGTADLLDPVAEVLQSADMTIGNLEGAVADIAPDDPARSLVLPLDTPAALAGAGFDLLSLANNHALDAGVAGMTETRRRMHAARLRTVEAGPAVVSTVHGLSLGVVAWNDLESADDAQLLEDVRAARQAADVVIVLIHWGQEYTRHPGLAQRELADDLLAAGADAVLGAHPHVVQDVRIDGPANTGDRASLVAFSLGNFAFDQGWDDTAQGLAVRMIFDGDGLRAVEALPLWTAPRPKWMNADDAAALLERILPSTRLGFVCDDASCHAAEVPEDARSGIFVSGAIDLTGDGVAETVLRRGERVEIREGSRMAWESPPEWRVRDLALGDPNDDGRHEVVLVVDKTEESGEVTSHPFVLGVRGGTYRELWGGSAVHAPLREVELADVDGDGLEELMTIESPPEEAAPTLTVWRWHGWGFSMVWRSEPAPYRDLLVLPAEGEQTARLSVVAVEN